MLKLGIEVSQATVGRYMVRRHSPPSPTWLAFLRNQIDGIAAIDMFVVVTVAFRLLYESVILGHARRKILHLNVTQHSTSGWLSRQITEAFPWDTVPRYLRRPRCVVWSMLSRARSSDGDHRGRYGATIALAECVRRVSSARFAASVLTMWS